jgi:hypothetical protein
MKYPKLAAALAVLLILMFWLVTPAQTLVNVPNELQAQLESIAKEALETQTEVLVMGNAPTAIEGKPLASAYKDLIQDKLEALVARRDALAEKEVKYTSFQTQLAVTKVDLNRTRATLCATEHTSLTLKSEDGPPTTEYEVDHCFDFVLRKGGWKLIADHVVNTTKPEKPDPDEVPAYPPSGDAPQTGPMSYMRLKEPRMTLAAFSPVSFSHYAAIAPSTNFDRSAVVAYATKYCFKYNTKYRTEGNDCTNFASQALYAGGWSMQSGWYQSDSVWWYNFSAFLSPYHSYTWAGAHNFFWFTYGRPRALLTTTMSQLQPGDILQVDWNDAKGNKTPDGHIDHTMIVTAKNSKGEIFLTYHSNNNLNRPFTELLKLEPKAKWYGWRMYSYPN